MLPLHRLPLQNLRENNQCPLGAAEGLIGEIVRSPADCRHSFAAQHNPHLGWAIRLTFESTTGSFQRLPDGPGGRLKVRNGEISAIIRRALETVQPLLLVTEPLGP